MQYTTKNVINLLKSTQFAVQQCNLKRGGDFNTSNDSIQDEFALIMQTLEDAQKLCKKLLA